MGVKIFFSVRSIASKYDTILNIVNDRGDRLSFCVIRIYKKNYVLFTFIFIFYMMINMVCI